MDHTSKTRNKMTSGENQEKTPERERVMQTSEMQDTTDAVRDCVASIAARLTGETGIPLSAFFAAFADSAHCPADEETFARDVAAQRALAQPQPMAEQAELEIEIVLEEDAAASSSPPGENEDVVPMVSEQAPEPSSTPSLPKRARRISPKKQVQMDFDWEEDSSSVADDYDDDEEEFVNPEGPPDFQEDQIDEMPKKRLILELSKRELIYKGLNVIELRRALHTATYPHFIQLRVKRHNEEWANSDDLSLPKTPDPKRNRVSFGGEEINLFKKNEML